MVWGGASISGKTMDSLLNKITVQDMSILLGISKETVIKLAVTKQLPAVQDGNKLFFYFTEVKRYFSELKEDAA